MAIKELTKATLGKTKVGWRWDKKRELWTTWQVDTVFNGTRHLRRGFRTTKEAEKYLEQLDIQERLKEIGVIQLIKYPTVAELFNRRLADLENIAEKVRALRVFAQFQTLVEPTTTIDHISKVHFKKFADLRISEGVHKKTVNREINPIAKAFSSVPDYFNLPNWQKPQVFRFSVSREGRKRLIEESEYRVLLEYFLKPIQPGERPERFKARYRTGLILQFALMTGLRHGEICGMEKAKLNRKRREIDVYRFKTRHWKSYSPLTETMLTLLDEGAKLYPEGDYFFSEHGKLQVGFYSQMKEACQKFRIPYGKSTAGGLILHDARHTFSTILHQNLIDNTTATEFTDNPTAISNYQHSTHESKTRAMAIIEKQFGNDQRTDEAQLREIFDQVRAGEMEFEQFEQTIKDLLTVF